MNFALLVYEAQAGLELRRDRAKAPGYMSGLTAFAGELAKAGVIRGGAAFDLTAQGDPGDGTTLGGFFLVDVPDAATARDWARRCPVADGGSVEVRKLLPPQG